MPNYKNLARVFLLGCFSFCSFELYGTGFQLMPKNLKSFSSSHKNLSGAFKLSQDTNKSFQLIGDRNVGFALSMQKYIRDAAALSPYIELRTDDSKTNIGQIVRSESQKFSFFVDDVPLCHYEIRANLSRGDNVYVIGSAPVTDFNPTSKEDWPDLDEAFERFADRASEEGYGERSQLVRKYRCYLVSNYELRPVWKMYSMIDGYSYVGYADQHETYSIDKNYFTATGSAKVYPNNDFDTAVETIDLVRLKGDGSLTSEFLKSAPNLTSNGAAKAYNAGNVFDYAPEAPEYPQVASFTHAQRHIRFFESLGFEWYGPKPLDIVIHESPGGNANNALFQPAGARNSNGSLLSVPTITIGDGSNGVLQKLPRDADVVSHELGHHVVYQTLTSTSGESLIMHEGLADFFAYARTGDGCLGESICPATSTACQVKGQCLRTAENTLTYNSTAYNNYGSMAHLKSQVISGLLWDLNASGWKSGDIPLADLRKIVLRAVELLVSNSGFEHLALSLVNADDELYDGKYFDAIREAFVARGFDLYLERIPSSSDDRDEVPTPLEVERASGSVDPSEGEVSTSSGTTHETSKKKTVLCGTIATKNPKFSGLFLVLVLLAPFGLFLVPTRVPQRVRVSRKKL